MENDRNIPVLKPDVLVALPIEPQPKVDEASRKLYEDTHKGVVQIRTDKGRSSSGFVVDDGSRLVTTANTVAESVEQFAIDNSGKRYKLEIERMDDVSNLAILRIKNGSIPNARTMKLGETQPLQSDDKVWGVSYPRHIDSRMPYLSPGYLRGIETPIELISDMNPGLIANVETNLKRLDNESRSDAQTFLSQPLLEAKLHIEPGGGGSPVFDKDGKVIGVTLLTNTGKPYEGTSLLSPVDYVKGLLTDNKGKFEFQYGAHAAAWAEDYLDDWQNNKTQAILSTGFAGLMGGIAFKGAQRFPLAAGAALGGYGLVKFSSDANRFLTSTDSTDNWKYGLATLSDLGTIGGAAMSFAPKFRGYGLALAGLGLAGRAATDFIKNHWVVEDMKRISGNPDRLPFNLDQLLKNPSESLVLNDTSIPDELITPQESLAPKEPLAPQDPKIPTETIVPKVPLAPKTLLAPKK